MDLQQLKGIATYHLGVWHDLKGRHEQSLSYLEEALEIWRQVNNRRWQDFTLNSIGTVAQKISRLERAKSALEEALLISKANDDRQGQASTLNNLSLLATELGDYVGAKQRLMQALALARLSGDEEHQARLHSNLAWNAKRADWFEEALVFAGRALESFQQIGNEQEASNVRQLLAELEKYKHKKRA